MGEAQGTLFEPEFNRSIKIQTSEQKITSHAGAVLLREVDHQLGLVESLAEQLADPRDAKKIRYTAIELLRERIYALALGSENQDDLDRLAHDPAMRMATWDRPGEEVLQQRLASQPTQSRLIDWLAFPKNLEALRSSLFDWTHRHLRSTGRGGNHAVMRATIDVDSFPIVVHGQQQGGSYNGYYRDTVYHPLPRQLLCTRRLRQHPRRPPLGQRLHPCDAQARTSSHGSRCAAVHEACGPTCSSDSAEF